MTRKTSFAFIVLLLAALACNLPGAATPAPPPPPLPTETAVPASTPIPTLAPTSETPPVLPAPLYFISASDQQIWRVSRDGVTLTRITNEPAPITAYDVSPVDGALAYVSGNSLFRADADGGNVVLLVDGPEIGSEDGSINRTVTNPLWSPDGARIAYGLNGANIIPAGGGEPQVIQQSSPYPDLNSGTRPTEPVIFYWPTSWSPDGTRLLLNFGYFPEGGGLAVKTLADGALVEVTTPESFACCYPTWSADGQSIYFANDSPGMIGPGLWQAPADSGVAATLIPGVVENTLNLSGHARQLADGQLYFFYATQPFDPTLPPQWPPQLVMHRASADGAGLTALRTDISQPGEVLWAEDGSGAVILQLSPDTFYPFHGPLVWLDAADNPAVTLPVDGSTMRWGK